jgi:hypothetical protein
MVNMVQVLLCSLDNPPILEISTNAASVAYSWGFEKMVKCYLNSWESIDPYITTVAASMIYCGINRCGIIHQDIYLHTNISVENYHYFYSLGGSIPEGHS